MNSTSSTPPTTPKVTPQIVLGVAGGVAAYKAVLVLRQLVDAGYNVAPVLTPDALHFVGASTFSALATEPARTSLYADPTSVSPHTMLGQRADLVVVAPATANFIARFAMGLATDLLSATVLATRAPLLLCPAMHTEMWEQPSVQANLALLRQRGVLIMEPASGHLAGGDVGPGRLREPEEIVAMARAILDGYRGPLTGRTLVVSAGGTRESIDPVRSITNRSSGHQGHAVAEVATRLGASVTLVTTSDRPLALDVAQRIDVIRVESASEMHHAMERAAVHAHGIIMAAAVADFTVEPVREKIKKADGIPVLQLTPTIDIVRSLVAARRPGQIIVGFAAETSDVVARAQEKLLAKNLDLIVVNDVTAPGTGFGVATNAVTLLAPGAAPEELTIASKEAIAEQILARVSAMFARGAQ